MSLALRHLALPKTLLARNIALLIVLVMLSQVCSLAVLLHYVQRPRVERTAAVFANYVTTLDGLFEAAPNSARSALVARLNQGAQPPGADELEAKSSLAHFYITYQPTSACGHAGALASPGRAASLDQDSGAWRALLDRAAHS
jgi:two-component system osmolarity sensor histidine kinase EnvZ